jgi:hypothetical protein
VRDGENSWDDWSESVVPRGTFCAARRRLRAVTVSHIVIEEAAENDGLTGAAFVFRGDVATAGTASSTGERAEGTS